MVFGDEQCPSCGGGCGKGPCHRNNEPTGTDIICEVCRDSFQSRITQLEEEYAEYKATMETLHVQAKATIAELQRKYESLGDNVDFHVGQLEQTNATHKEHIQMLEKHRQAACDLAQMAIDIIGPRDGLAPLRFTQLYNKAEKILSQVADSKEE